MLSYDVLVVGGGVAGLRAALEAVDRSKSVAIISRTHPLRSSSTGYQGAINAPLAKDDSPGAFVENTLACGDGLNDPAAVEAFAGMAVETIAELDRWGMPFSRLTGGAFSQQTLGGSRFPRACHAQDRTGFHLVQTLFEQTFRKGIRIHEEWIALSLVIEQNVCHGVIAYDLLNGDFRAIKAKGVIFATGGSGRIFAGSTNGYACTGHALSVALEAGAPLRDMEFVQFHPLTTWGKNLFLTDACLTEGGVLLNKDQEKIPVQGFSREVLSRTMIQEIQAGRGVEDTSLLLDLRPIGKASLEVRLPEVTDLCRTHLELDPAREPIPVVPGQHGMLGGIATGWGGDTVIKGLFAAGQCACNGFHGAGALPGSEFLASLAGGKTAAISASEYVKTARSSRAAQGFVKEALTRVEESHQALFQGHGSEDPAVLRKELQGLMSQSAGVFRSGENLEEALKQWEQLAERTRCLRPSDRARRYNLDKVAFFDLKGDLTVAEAILKAALWRQESRGCHARTDFPERLDKKFKTHSLSTLAEDGRVAVNKE